MDIIWQLSRFFLSWNKNNSLGAAYLNNFDLFKIGITGFILRHAVFLSPKHTGSQNTHRKQCQGYLKKGRLFLSSISALQKVAEETWEKNPRRCLITPDPADRLWRPKKQALQLRSINYRFEWVHSCWMVLFFVLCTPGVDQRNYGNTWANSGHNQLTISAGGQKVQKRRETLITQWAY